MDQSRRKKRKKNLVSWSLSLSIFSLHLSSMIPHDDGSIGWDRRKLIARCRAFTLRIRAYRTNVTIGEALERSSKRKRAILQKRINNPFLYYHKKTLQAETEIHNYLKAGNPLEIVYMPTMRRINSTASAKKEKKGSNTEKSRKKAQKMIENRKLINIAYNNGFKKGRSDHNSGWRKTLDRNFIRIRNTKKYTHTAIWS